MLLQHTYFHCLLQHLTSGFIAYSNIWLHQHLASLLTSTSSSSTSENPEAEKQKSVEQEAAPMSTSTPRAPLTQDERVLFQELLDAVGCHQEIEEENDRLRHENQRLKDELAQLKRSLSL